MSKKHGTERIPSRHNQSRDSDGAYAHRRMENNGLRPLADPRGLEYWADSPVPRLLRLGELFATERAAEHASAAGARGRAAVSLRADSQRNCSRGGDHHQRRSLQLVPRSRSTNLPQSLDAVILSEAKNLTRGLQQPRLSFFGPKTFLRMTPLRRICEPRTIVLNSARSSLQPLLIPPPALRSAASAGSAIESRHREPPESAAAAR